MGFIETFLTAFGGTAVAGAVLGYLGKAFLESRLDKDLENHKSLLESAADLRSRERDEAASIKDTVRRYSRVIMLSAEDAQDRLWHLCERQAAATNKVLDAEDELKPIYGAWPMTKRHYLLGTMYFIGRYLCWVEILKDQIRLLEFNDEDDTREFSYHIKRVERALADTSVQTYAAGRVSTDKPLFQLMQSEIGECFRTGNPAQPGCIGFLAFQEQYESLAKRSDAIRRLEELIMGSRSDAKSNFCLPRLKLLSNALMDLVVFLHQHNKLAPAEGLEKVSIIDFDMEQYLQTWPSVPAKST